MKVVLNIALFIYLCVSCPTNVFSQELNFKEYGALDGLPSGVKALFQDSRGYIWIGAEGGGLLRYDGKFFKSFSTREGLSAQGINAICEDDHKCIWIGSYAGLFRYDGSKFVDFSKKLNLSSNEWIVKIKKDKKGRLWLYSNAGHLFTYDGKNFTLANKTFGLTNKFITIFFIDSKDNIWFEWNAPDEGFHLVKHNGKNLENYSFSKSMPVVCDIKEDRNGRIWLATFDGLYGLYGKIFYPFNFTAKQCAVFSLDFDNLDNVWLGAEAGLYKGRFPKISGITKDSILFSHDSSSSNSFKNIQSSQFYYIVNSFLLDNANNVWLALQNGVKVYKGGTFTHYTKPSGVAAMAIDFYADGMDRIWFRNGTSWRWKYLLNDSVFVDLILPKPDNGVTLNDNSFFNSFFDSKGNIWFSSWDKGLFVYSNGKMREFVDKNVPRQQLLISGENKAGLLFGVPVPNPKSFFWIDPSIEEDKLNFVSVFSENMEELKEFYIDSEGRKWVGHLEKGFGLIGENKIIWYGKKQGLMDGYDHRLLEDSKGRIWIRSQKGNYVYVFENGKFAKYTFDGATQEDFRELSEDSFGRIWAPSMAHGALYFDGKKFKEISIKNELINNSVLFVKQDKQKNLWVGTMKGISKMFVDEKGEIIRIKNYGHSEGFKGIECNTTAMHEDAKGNIWFGTTTVFTKYSPSADKLNIHAPILNFTGLELFYNAYDWSKGNREINTWTGMPQTLTLPYNQNHLTFSFVGIDMKSSDKVRYKFMLEGEEDEWSPAVAKNEVTYSALAPGTYTFKVKSCNSDGIWNEDALSYTFTINPPWWRTFWFKAVGVVSIIVIIFLIFKWRTRSLLNKQRQLEKVIEERTQEITQQRDEIEEKQKEILDSINYAKRLQQAILAPLDEITRHLANNFLLYLPKDIVAGDFYFFEITENHIFIAAADCTGHGVPGALVSIVCSNALSRSVNEFSLTEPGKILDKTREMVIDTFKKSGQDVKDGMDISFIAINRATNEVSWSGSNNPLWIYQNGKMEEITANKQPIGISDKAVAFTTHKLKVASGDTLFLFTDGYADQFGGPKGKKFKYSNMQELLIEINDLTMSEQLKKLHAAFNLWKGDLEQVDDVCIIGIKL